MLIETAPAPSRPAPPHERPSSFAIDVPEALLVRARAGERAAFEQVYRRFERPVFTLALRICGEREAASDVLQDTMLRLFDRIGDYRAVDGAPFWGWLRQVAVNEALMRMRRAKARGGAALELPDDDGLPDDLLPPPSAAADAAVLQRALARLPVATRSVLWLYHAEGYTHEVISLTRETIKLYLVD